MNHMQRNHQRVSVDLPIPAVQRILAFGSARQASAGSLPVAPIANGTGEFTCQDWPGTLGSKGNKTKAL